MELKFSPPILEKKKCPHPKFQENPFTESRAVSCGRTDNRDRHDEANTLTQYCQRALKEDSVP